MGPLPGLGRGTLGRACNAHRARRGRRSRRRRLDAQGESTGRRSEPFADTETAASACDREGKIVSASTRTTGNLTDVVLHAYLDPEQPPVWQATYAGQGMGDDQAATLACDAWGYCAWGGYEWADGKNRAIVQIHYP